MKDLEKQFNRTLRDAQDAIKTKRQNEDKNLCSSQIFNSTTHLLISLEKFLETLQHDDILKNKQHIDNIYYHLGAIEGCL
jgi:hypothetical protein